MNLLLLLNTVFTTPKSCKKTNKQDKTANKTLLTDRSRRVNNFRYSEDFDCSKLFKDMKALDKLLQENNDLKNNYQNLTIILDKIFEITDFPIEMINPIE